MIVYAPDALTTFYVDSIAFELLFPTDDYTDYILLILLILSILSIIVVVVVVV